MVSDGFRLPGYLRLLLLLNRRGKVNVGKRREFGFSLNDAEFLKSFGLIRESDGFLELTDKGREVVREIAENALDPAVVRKALELLLQHVDKVLADIESLSKSFDGYWLEMTWVYNKVKAKYYYYYLKSRTRKPRSIYLGKSPEKYSILKNLRQYAKKLRHLQGLILELLANLQHLEFSATLAEKLKTMNTSAAK